MKKVVSYLLIFNILAKLIAFFRDVVLSFFFGTSEVVDAYVISFTIPTLFLSIIGASIINSTISIEGKIIERDEKNNFISSLISTYLFITVLVSLLLFIFSNLITDIIFSGVSENVNNLASIFTRISTFSIILMSIINVLLGFLNNKGKFIYAAVINIIFNVSVIISIVLANYYNVLFLPYGRLFGYFLQIILLINVLKKYDFKYKFEKKFYENLYVKEFFYLSIPIYITSIFTFFSKIIEKNIASFAFSGAISILNYANRILFLFKSLLITSFATIFISKISKLNSEKKSFNLVFYEFITNISFLLIPISMIVFFFSYEITDLIYGRGSFNDSDVLNTSLVLTLYSIGLIAQLFKEFLQRIYYLLNKTKRLMIILIIGTIINSILYVFIFNLINLKGLALASSLTLWIISFILYVDLYKYTDLRINKIFLLDILKITFISLISIVISQNIIALLNININLHLNFIIKIILIISLYLLQSLLFKQKTFMVILNEINKSLRRKKND